MGWAPDMWWADINECRGCIGHDYGAVCWQPLSAPLVHTLHLSPLQESVHLAVASRPEQFVTAKEQGTAATEEMLDAVSAYYGLKAQ